MGICIKSVTDSPRLVKYKSNLDLLIVELFKFIFWIFLVNIPKFITGVRYLKSYYSYKCQ